MFSLTQVSLHNCFLEHQVIHLLADSLTEEGKLKLHLHTTGRTAGPDLTYRGIKRSPSTASWNWDVQSEVAMVFRVSHPQSLTKSPWSIRTLVYKMPAWVRNIMHKITIFLCAKWPYFLADSQLHWLLLELTKQSRQPRASALTHPVEGYAKDNTFPFILPPSFILR